MRQYKRAIAFVLILAAVIAIIPKNDSERKVEAAPAATPTPTVATSPSSTPAGTPVSTIYPETGTIETAAPTMVPTAAPTATVTPAMEVTPVPTPVITPAPATEEIRGVWIAFYEYKKAGLKNKSEAVFRKNADKLFKKIKDNGCNAVFFHVRAFDDAIWPSENFKFSSYMGKKTPNYDPLAILVESAHKYGLKFHAWMNPYRITQKKIYDPAKDQFSHGPREYFLSCTIELMDSIHASPLPQRHEMPDTQYPKHTIYQFLLLSIQALLILLPYSLPLISSFISPVLPSRAGQCLFHNLDTQKGKHRSKKDSTKNIRWIMDIKVQP